MDYFAAAAAHRSTYFDSPPETDSSNPASPDLQNIRRPLQRFGSIDSVVSPQDPTWEPIDLAAFDTITDLNNPSFHQTLLPQSPDSDKATVPPSKVRRRAQNRASQRAFRERKEKHVKSLETQLELLHEKHQDLLCTFNKQSDSVDKLNRKVEKLKGDLKVLRAATTGRSPLAAAAVQGMVRAKASATATTTITTTGPVTMRMNDKFDAFAFAEEMEVPETALTSLYDGYDLGLDGMIVNEVEAGGGIVSSMAGDDAGHQLPDFEDLLRTP